MALILNLFYEFVYGILTKTSIYQDQKVRWLINWKERGRKRLWLNLRYCQGLCWRNWRRAQKSLIRVTDVTADVRSGPLPYTRQNHHNFNQLVLCDQVFRYYIVRLSKAHGLEGPSTNCSIYAHWMPPSIRLGRVYPREMNFVRTRFRLQIIFFI